MRLKNITKKLNIIIEIIIPVLIACSICLHFGVGYINNQIKEQILNYAQSELKSFMSHLIFNAEKNYEYLFYRYATDLETFTEAQDLSKKETIESFKENLEQSPFLGYIIADGEIIDLNKYQSEPTPTLAQLSTQNEFTKNYISNTAQFNPWGWNIILLYNDNQAMKIANSNALLIVIYSTGLILIFILITALMLKFAVYSPLKKILNHFGNLNEKNNETNLELYGSKETFNIARNINIIAKKILDRERELISQKERYTNIINSQHSIIFVITRMQITYRNSAFYDFFKDFPNSNEITNDYKVIATLFLEDNEKDFYTPSNINTWYKELYKYNELSAKVLINKNGKNHIFTICSHPMKDDNSFIVVLSDITALESYKIQLQQQKDDLKQQLITDNLTALPNRYALIQRIQEAEICSLAIFNINDFKEINDFYGTKTGDKILFEYGQKINYFAQIYKLEAYKLSGDEYALLFTGYKKIEACINVIQAILALLDQEVFTDESNDKNIHLISTVGLTTNTQFENILIQADIALKTAKKEQKNLMTYANSQNTKDSYAKNREMSLEIKNAIINNNVIPYFQPIYNNKTKKIEKYEALMRIITQDNKILVPYFFLDIAKKSHQYVKLTEKMIESTFYYMSTLPYDFSINLSDIDISDKHITDILIRTMADYNIQNRVILEITETENIKDYDLVINFIEEARRFGAKIAIDDFGSGFSNFYHIAKFKVDFIKIDGSLVKNIMRDKNSLIIVQTIHNFAKEIGAKTIAEYVDNVEVFDKVVEIGIDYTQGYYISQPLATIY